MDIKPEQQSINDDQELAKALAGMTDDASTDAAAPLAPAMPPVPPTPMPEPDTPEPVVAEPVMTPVEPIIPTAAPAATPVMATDSALDAIKAEALGELRPLVDKLDVSPEEKFDTYLLLLRSTDDKDLIAPAHEAARSIADEARRAQALLDVIKEIDFLSNNQ
jgi:hypothetical protein